jgi:hypothetical protein
VLKRDGGPVINALPNRHQMTDDELKTLKPPFWSDLVRAASALGSTLGDQFMRIDLYASKSGRPVLGEFTTFPSAGKSNCAIPVWPNDTCTLGRLWRQQQERFDRRTPPEKLCAARDLLARAYETEEVLPKSCHLKLSSSLLHPVPRLAPELMDAQICNRTFLLNGH